MLKRNPVPLNQTKLLGKIIFSALLCCSNYTNDDDIVKFIVAGLEASTITLSIVDTSLVKILF